MSSVAAETSESQRLHLWSRLWDLRFARMVDEQSCQDLGVPAAALMETAGRAVAAAVRQRYSPSRPVLALCGPGNNGADAMVAVRVLIDAGYSVQVVHVSQTFPARLSALAATQKAVLDRLNIPQVRYAPGLLQRAALQKPILIDGVLGVGFAGALQAGPVLDALREASKLPEATTVAVDLPSGLNADAVGPGFAEPPLPADVTVSFGGSRPCFIGSPQRQYCGQVLIEEIGFPRAAIQQSRTLCAPVWWHGRDVAISNPYQAMGPDRHKFDRGMVAVIGGSAGKLGAPCLAAMSALRTGCGWATVAIPGGTAPSLPVDLTREDLFQGEELLPDRLRNFLQLRPVRALVLGPGATENFLKPEHMGILRTYCEAGGFLVFDAAATHGLRELLANSPLCRERAVATPHPGEWTKMGLPEQPGVDPKAVQQLADVLGVTLIYKNATPLLFTGQLPAGGILDFGGPEMSKAGAGDVLAGCIAALGAAGLSAAEAVHQGLRLVARAASLATVRVGTDAVTASDMVEWLGIALGAESQVMMP